MKKYILGFVYLFFFYSYANEESIRLNQLFFHKGTLADNLICYFDKKPRFFVAGDTEKKQAAHAYIEFFLPSVYPHEELKNMITQINNEKRNNYTMQFTQVNVPSPGIKITISYDPKKIACQYASCCAISRQESLVISFHNIELLNTLNNAQSGILKTVQNDYMPKKIILDYGHGGHDEGKVGFFGLKEKDINLSIGKKLAHLLKNKGFDVLYTRNDDIFVPLDMRTSQANMQRADLFVSIHANAGPQESHGIETYWVGKSNLAWKHNYHEGHQGALTIQKTYHSLDTASKNLATTIHDALITTVTTLHTSIKNRRIKETSLAQVLFGTEMPSVLIEVGFLSNKDEAQQLADPSYQQLLAQGICNGIELYCKHA